VSFVRRQRLLIVWLEHPYLILAPCLQWCTSFFVPAYYKWNELTFPGCPA
jgi:hypothetical protein